VPAVPVRNVRIRPLLEQILPEPVVPVLRRRQQRRPPELARLINVRTRLQQQLHRLQIPFARRKNQRRQTARVLRLLPPTAERELALIVAGLGVRIRLGRRARLGGGSGRNGGRRRGRLEARGQRADRLGERGHPGRERVEPTRERRGRVFAAVGSRLLRR